MFAASDRSRSVAELGDCVGVRDPHPSKTAKDGVAGHVEWVSEASRKLAHDRPRVHSAGNE
jgi:hypothetical protein